MPWYLQYLDEKYEDKDFLLISIISVQAVTIPLLTGTTELCCGATLGIYEELAFPSVSESQFPRVFQITF